MFVERIIARLPSVEALFAKEANAIVGTIRAGIEVEAGFGKLFFGVSEHLKNDSYGITRTLAGVICLCGQFRALEPPRPLEVEPRFFVVFRNDARRPSYVKYWSVS